MAGRGGLEFSQQINLEFVEPAFLQFGGVAGWGGRGFPTGLVLVRYISVHRLGLCAEWELPSLRMIDPRGGPDTDFGEKNGGALVYPAAAGCRALADAEVNLDSGKNEGRQGDADADGGFEAVDPFVKAVDAASEFLVETVDPSVKYFA